MSQNSPKPIVDLIEFDDLGLIILFPSGVIYTNQVGGLGCLHPEFEGIFVPLSAGNRKIIFALGNHFRGSWTHLEEKDAKVVDRLLRNDRYGYLKVDRENLEKSFEAWIYVEVTELNDSLPLIKGFGKTKGVLTWANSD